MLNKVDKWKREGEGKKQVKSENKQMDRALNNDQTHAKRIDQEIDETYQNVLPLEFFCFFFLHFFYFASSGIPIHCFTFDRNKFE